MPSFDMGLGELQAYKPALTAAPDFDGFWRDTFAQADKLPLAPLFTPYAYPARGAEVFDVRFTGWAGARISAWYIKPRGAGPFPAILHNIGYPSYRGMPHQHFAWIAAGFAVLVADVRGQPGLAPDVSTYTSGHTQGWMTKGILDPQEYYFRGVYVDAVRALDVLLSRPEVDGRRVAVHGASQGGGLTLAVTGLDHRPVAAMCDIPFLCHFQRSVEVAETFPYLEIANYLRQYPEREGQVWRTLSYFDGMNLGARVQCPTLMSVGLIDKTCPPSTGFAVYNNMTCPREMVTFRYQEHAQVEPHFQRRLAWAQRYLWGE
jgi:cephalosporin-C deacetylase